jgi:(R,R)-butanediol dehydrogenase/meso-butanediol dehydrogenase/diacetyl reductase
MRALLFYGRRDIRIEDISRPVPKEDEVLLKVTEAGLSQTQISEFIEGPYIINNQPHPMTGIGAPLIPCQEYGGEIVEVGSTVAKSMMGKQVAVLPLIYCGRCKNCLAGNVHYCSQNAYYGLVGAHGGFCEYSAVNVNNVIEVEDRSLLSFVEPLLVAAHSFNRYQKDVTGKKVLVLGAGAVGLSCAALWQKMGAKSLTIYDNLPNRLKIATNSGLHTVNDTQELMGQFDVVIDAAGKDPASQKQAFELAPDYLKQGGTLILIGTYFFPLELVPAQMLVTETTYLPSYMYDLQDVDLLRTILSELDFPFSNCIKRVAFDDIIQEGYYQAELDKDTFVRIVTSVDES